MNRKPQLPSDTRRLNMLKRLLEEHGAAQTSKLFARALQETPDPAANTIREHLLAGVVRAESKIL